MTFAVVRVRGKVDVRRDVQDTLAMLRLHRVNHCVVVPATDSARGMLQKAKDYLTWGEVTPEVLADLVRHRGRAVGDRRVDDAYVRAHSAFDSVESLARALAEGEARLEDVEGLKPVFRLAPPRKGYEGVKRGFADGGALGYRGEAINDLLLRMMGQEA